MYYPQVHEHKIILMQRIQDCVARGYIRHIAGTVPLTRAPAMADKFARLYHVDHNANQRAYAKRQGRANARLFLYATADSDHLAWWLLVTNGTGEIHKREKLHDVTERRHRLHIGKDYELVRHTRKSEHGGGQTWTWRMTKVCKRTWRRRIILACRQTSEEAIRDALQSLCRTPGFAGIRQQAGQLITLARREWQRRHGNRSLPLAADKLSYVARMADQAISLRDLLQARGYVCRGEWMMP